MMADQYLRVSRKALNALEVAIAERANFGRDDPQTGKFIELSDDELDANLHAAFNALTASRPAVTDLRGPHPDRHDPDAPILFVDRQAGKWVLRMQSHPDIAGATVEFADSGDIEVRCGEDGSPNAGDSALLVFITRRRTPA